MLLDVVVCLVVYCGLMFVVCCVSFVRVVYCLLISGVLFVVVCLRIGVRCVLFFAFSMCCFLYGCNLL